MNKKILFLILLVVGVCAITGVVLFTLRTPKPVQPVVSEAEPVATSTPVTTLQPRNPSAPAPAQQAPVDPNSPAEQERQARERLFRASQDFAARLGTYANTDDFVSVTAMYPQVTAEVQTYLEQQRTLWRQAHPAGHTWGQTTRALTARLVIEKPILTATEAEVIVDTQQRVDEGAVPVTTLKRAHFLLAKRGEKWIVSRLSWEETQL